MANLQNIDSNRKDLFSYFRHPITNKISERTLSVADLYKEIVSDLFKRETVYHRTLSPDQAKRNKPKAFDYITPHGVFPTRSDDAMTSLSGYFVADIDGQDAYFKIKAALVEDTVLDPALIFTSPSGDGLKVFVNIDIALINSHGPRRMERIWNAVNAYFGQKYAGLIVPDARGNFIDPSGKDLSRACFVCYDPEAFYNPNAGNLGNDFIAEYGATRATGKNRKCVSPLTTLQDLAARHLSNEGNRTPELLAFVCGAIEIGADAESVLQYIANTVPIAEDSSKKDAVALRAFVDDLFNRYGAGPSGIIRLTPLQFAVGILLFKHSKEANAYVLSGLYYEGVRQRLHDAGFAKRYTSPGASVYIQRKGAVISEASTEQMRDCLTGYVEQFAADLKFKYQGIDYQIPNEAIREIYLKNSNNIFNKVWLEHLQTHETPILKDTRSETYFFFRNALVVITAGGITRKPWEQVQDFCIWDTQQIPHDFEYTPDNHECKFATFFYNVNNQDPKRILAMASGLGYLMNHSCSPSQGQAVIFYDESIADVKAPQGGSGKGLLSNAVKQVRDVRKIDGKHLDAANRFRWELVTPSTQVVWLDDVKPDFDFTVLFSNLTDGWTIERKYLNQFHIAPEDSPKVLICSNSIIKSTGAGSSVIRRQFVYELGDHYSRQILRGDEKPIEREHGGLFFSTDWATDEWNKFYSFMADCGKLYLKDGITLQEGVNVERNRLIQSTNEDFTTWCDGKNFEPMARNWTKELFTEFSNAYYGASTVFSQRSFTNWLKLYAAFKGWAMRIDQSNGVPFFQFYERLEPAPF